MPRFEDSTGKPRTKSLNEPLLRNDGTESPQELSDSEEEKDEAVLEGATAARKSRMDLGMLGRGGGAWEEGWGRGTGVLK